MCFRQGGQLRLRRREHEADGRRARQREDDLGRSSFDEAHRAARQLGLKRRVRLILRQRRLDFEQPARRRLLRGGVRKCSSSEPPESSFSAQPARGRPGVPAGRSARRRRAGGEVPAPIVSVAFGSRPRRLRQRARMMRRSSASRADAWLGMRSRKSSRSIVIRSAVSDALSASRSPVRASRRRTSTSPSRASREQLERRALDADVELRPREHRDGQRDRRVVGRRGHVDEVEHHRVLVVLRPRRPGRCTRKVDPVRAAEQLDGEPLGAQSLLGDDERRAVVVVHGDGEPRHRAVRDAGERGAALLGRHLVLRRARLKAEVKDRQVAPGRSCQLSSPPHCGHRCSASFDHSEIVSSGRPPAAARRPRRRRGASPSAARASVARRVAWRPLELAISCTNACSPR